nr:hypothetical protein [Aeromicrobium sp.]
MTATGSGATEELVRRLESVRFQAVVERDWDRFAACCHADLRYTHNTGVVDTRDSYLTKLRADHYDYHWITHEIDHVRVGPGAVLVWGTMAAELRAGATQKALRNHILSVWVQEGERWLLVAQQPTPVPG